MGIYTVSTLGPLLIILIPEFKCIFCGCLCMCFKDLLMCLKKVRDKKRDMGNLPFADSLLKCMEQAGLGQVKTGI